jgi:hypothetical protein
MLRFDKSITNFFVKFFSDGLFLTIKPSCLTPNKGSSVLCSTSTILDPTGTYYAFVFARLNDARRIVEAAIVDRTNTDDKIGLKRARIS